jgi:hypothetical protein
MERIMEWQDLLDLLKAAIYGLIVAGFFISNYFLLKSMWGNKVSIEHTSQIEINNEKLEIQHMGKNVENLIINTLRLRIRNRKERSLFRVVIDAIATGKTNTFLELSQIENGHGLSVVAEDNKIILEQEKIDKTGINKAEEFELIVLSDTCLQFSVSDGGEKGAVEVIRNGKLSLNSIYLSTANITLILLLLLMSITVDYFDFNLILTIITLSPLAMLIALRIFTSNRKR